MNFVIALFGKIAGAVAGNTVLAWIAPLFTGAASAIGALITAVAEIVLALSKSPEGRVFLAICAVSAGLLYGRFHWIEQGRLEEQILAAEHIKLATAHCQPAPAKRKP
jgi:choline-glycine betaine transporter